MAFQIIQGFQPKRLKKCKAMPLTAKGIDDCMHGHAYVMMIRLPHSRVLRLIARSLLLALIFATLPMLRTILGGASSQVSTPAVLQPEAGSSSIDFNLLSMLFRDLANEGLLKAGDKAVIVSSNVDGNDHDIASKNSQLLLGDFNIDVDVISVSDMDQQGAIPEESVDLAFSYGLHNGPGFIDRALKIGGIAVVQMSDTPFFEFNKPYNYKIVYFRRFESSVLAMRKTGYASSSTNSATQRRLLGYGTEDRKAALKNLEDVLLEPPRAASRKSSRYLKKTRYLPDLTGDSLESYPRRVFIDVGLPEREGGSGTGWFAKNYPTRNLDFEMYKIETVTEESSGKEVPQMADNEVSGMPDWLRKNVKEEEYVVVKAEAEVVEEMVKGKAIGLVDELFLECKPRGPGGKFTGMRSRSRSRAYWECLALYGKLRDEGVAVHQWWG